MKHISHIDMGGSKRLSAADMNAIAFQTGRHSPADPEDQKRNVAAPESEVKGKVNLANLKSYICTVKCF